MHARNLVRVEPAMFHELPAMLDDRKSKNDTWYRNALAPGPRFTITLWFPVSGDSDIFVLFGTFLIQDGIFFCLFVFFHSSTSSSCWYVRRRADLFFLFFPGWPLFCSSTAVDRGVSVNCCLTPWLYSSSDTVGLRVGIGHSGAFLGVLFWVCMHLKEPAAMMLSLQEFKLCLCLAVYVLGYLCILSGNRRRNTGNRIVLAVSFYTLLNRSSSVIIRGRTVFYKKASRWIIIHSDNQ